MQESVKAHMQSQGDRLVPGPDGVTLNMVRMITTDEMWTKRTRIFQQAVKRHDLGGTDAVAQEHVGVRFRNTVAAMTDGSAAAAAPVTALALPATSPVAAVLAALSPAKAQGVASAAAASPVSALALPAPSAAGGEGPAAAAKAKAKAKAKVKASGKAGADGAAFKKKGRPAAGGAYMIDLGLAGLFDCKEDTSTRFFGPDWKNTSRNWHNYLQDISDVLASSDDATEVAKLTKLHAQGTMVRRVLNPGNTHGWQSRQMLDAYLQAKEGLNSMDPKVPHPFRTSANNRFHMIRITTANTNELFWNALGTSQMLDMGFDEACIEKSQLNFYSGRVLTIVQESSDVVEVLTSMVNTFMQRWQAKLFLGSAVLFCEVDRLQNYVVPGQLPDSSASSGERAKRLQATIQNKDCLTYRSLHSCPRRCHTHVHLCTNMCI